MKAIQRLVIIAAIPAACSALPVAADPALEARVARLERMVRTQGPSELLLQVQRLQQEVQTLRGLVESQQNTLERLQGQQRDQYLDLEARLDDGEMKGSADAGSSGDAAAAGGRSELERADLDALTASPRDGGGAQTVPALPAPEAAVTPGERKAYRAAFDLLKERRYPEAIAAFEDQLRRYPQGRFTADAHFWLGETYYVTRDYAAALEEYDRLLARYPDSDRVPSAMLKVGYVHYQEGRRAEARAVLEEVVARYPDTTEANLAEDRLRRMGRSLR